MSFLCPIRRFWRFGRECSRVDVPLTVIDTGGEVEIAFRFDTGCDVTTVSEDVALRLGLPVGGVPAGVTGSTGSGVGRLVPVTFRFPPDALSGIPDPEVSSMWLVLAGQTHLALLSLQEVHCLYAIGTDDTTMYFTNR